MQRGGLFVSVLFTLVNLISVTSALARVTCTVSPGAPAPTVIHVGSHHWTIDVPARSSGDNIVLIRRTNSDDVIDALTLHRPNGPLQQVDVTIGMFFEPLKDVELIEAPGELASLVSVSSM